MAQSEILSTLIQLEVEPQVIVRTLRAIREVNSAMRSLQAATVANDAAGKKAVNSTRQQVEANNKLAESYRKAKEAAAQSQRQALQSAGSVGSSIAPLRGVVGGAGGQAIGVGADVIELTEALPRLKDALKQVPDAIRAMASELGTTTPRLLALGVGLTALTVVFSLLQKQAEETRKAAQGAIQNALDYYTIVSTQSRKQIEDALAVAQSESQAANARFDAIAKFTIAFEEEIQKTGAVTGAMLELGNALGIAGTEIGAVREEFNKANKAVTDTRERVNNLTEALNSTEVAAREAAAAEEQLAAKRQQATDAFVNAQIATLIRAQALTGDQARERLEAIENEIAAIERFNAISGQSEANIAANDARLEGLRDEYQQLKDLIPTLIAYNDQLAYEKKQREETIAAVEKYNEKLKSIETDAAEARTAANQKYADAVIAIAQRAADAAKDALRKLEEQRAALAQQLARDEANAELQRQRDELDAQIDFAREEEKASRDHLASLKRIRREGFRDEQVAIQDRDAVALDAAQTRTKDTLDEENERFDRERKEREIAYKNLLADQRKQFARERADRFAKYQQDLNDAQAQYIREITLAQQKYNEELKLAQQAKAQELLAIQQKYTQAMALAKSNITQELVLISKGWQERLKIDAAYQQALINQAKSIMGAGTAGGSGLSGGSGFKGSGKPTIMPPSFDTGGRITRTGLILAHAGEVITNPRRGQSAGGVTINIAGAQEQMVTAKTYQQTLDIVGKTLKRMGVA